MDFHPATIVSLVVASAFGLAIMATILSKQANTAPVLQASFGGLGGLIQAAVSPIAGNTGSQINYTGSSQLTNPYSTA